MHVLIIDPDCCGLDLAWRAREAGHDVRWWMPSDKFGMPADGNGFPGLTKVKSWKESMKWAKDGLIVNLHNEKETTRALEAWRKFGYPIFGPSVASAELEWNRGKGMEFFEEHGIEVPKYRSFATLDAVIAAAWKADQPFVFKQTGDAEDKASSFVPNDPAELVGWLETKKAHGSKMKGPFILQEKVDLICEVGVSGWCGPNGFLRWKTVNFEFKKLISEHYGPNTGEMGTVIKYVSESKLAEAVLDPLEEALVKLGHIGDFDMNCGIKKNGDALPFEPTCRFGWPSSQIAMFAHMGDPVEWMRLLLFGRDGLSVDTRTLMGVLMAREPFPRAPENPLENVGYPIEGLEDVWEHISPWQIQVAPGARMKDGKVSKGKTYQTTGEYVCVANAAGPDVHDVIDAAYATVSQIRYPDPIVRPDVGKRLEKELPKLHALGYSEMPQW